jgi:hypothetical protein
VRELKENRSYRLLCSPIVACESFQVLQEKESL